MIMARNKDGTYSRVVAIKTRDDEDVTVAFDADGDAVFGALPSVEELGVPPLVFRANGMPLVDYSIKGNAVQAATPSLDNPVEVQAVGERTGNLFNGEITQGGLGDTNGATASMTSRVRTTKINVSENTIYTISSNLMIRNIIAYNNEAFVESAFNGAQTGDTRSSFTVPAGANQIAISFKGNLAGDIDITPNDFEWLMLNEGSTPLPYEPYGYKVDVVTRGKNLWYLQSSYSFTTYYDINVNINAGHYLSYIIETNGTTDVYGGTGCQLTFSDNTTQYVLFNATYRKSILLSKDVKIVRVYAGKDYNTSVGFTATVSEIMVSANADDSYEPYTPPLTTPIYLDSPLYKIGDYADTLCYAEQKVEWYIKELVLTGEEACHPMGDSLEANKHGIYTLYLVLSHLGVGGYCSHLVEDNTTFKEVSQESFALSNKERLYIRLAKSRIETIDDFEAYLKEQYNNGTPVKVWYVLATPESENVELPKLPTLSGTNILDVATEVKPSEVYIKYSTSKQAADYDKQLTDEYLNLMEGM